LCEICIVGIACICHSCRGYIAYMPEDDMEFAKCYMRKSCPLCGADLVIEQVASRGY
jgi:hypothetical protein